MMAAFSDLLTMSHPVIARPVLYPACSAPYDLYGIDYSAGVGERGSSCSPNCLDSIFMIGLS